MSRNDDLTKRIFDDLTKAPHRKYMEQLEFEAEYNASKDSALFEARDAVVESNKKLTRQVEALEKIAKAAETRADLALEKSKKADIKGIIAVVISLAAFVWSIVSHFI